MTIIINFITSYFCILYLRNLNYKLIVTSTTLSYIV